MFILPSACRRFSFANHHVLIQWASLLLGSVLFISLFEVLHLGAALLLGAMAAAILVAVMEGTVAVPRWPFMLSQGVIGCMIAHSMPLPILDAMLRQWPLFLAGVVSVILVSSLLGWLLVCFNVVPGTTALWGSSPGAALTMTLMAESYGADVRLVAFMQYLRVVCVALIASLIAQIFMGHHPVCLKYYLVSTDSSGSFPENTRFYCGNNLFCCSFPDSGWRYLIAFGAGSGASGCRLVHYRIADMASCYQL